MKTTLSNPDRDHNGRKNTVSKTLTPSARPKKAVDNDAYAAFMSRGVKAFARRVADGDIEALALLAAHIDEAEQACRDAITGLREQYGYSWSDIGRVLRVTKQTAQRKWGLKDGDL